MAGIFKANNPTNNILLIIYAVALRGAGFFRYEMPVRSGNDAFIYRAVLRFGDLMAGYFSWIYPFLTLVLILAQAFLLNRISNQLRLFPKPNYLVAISYLIIGSLVPHWYHFNAALVASTIIIWSFNEVIKLQMFSDVKGRLFNIGMAIGCCLFIFPPSIVFLIIIFAGLVLFKPFRLNEWLIVLIGVLVPTYFYYSWQFLNYGSLAHRLPKFMFHLPFEELNNVKLTIMLAFAVHVVGGFLYTQQNLRKQLVQTRNAWKLTYIYLVLSVVLFFITTAFNQFDQLFIVAPMALLAAAFHFYLPKKWMSNLFHILMLIFAIYIAYFYN